MKLKIAAAISTCVLMVGLLGCAGGDVAPAQDTNNASASASDATAGSGNRGSNATSNSSSLNSNGNAHSGAGTHQASITEDEAKDAALAHAGLDASMVSYTSVHLDYDDGLLVYEIEFVSGDVEYDYDINATDGTVVGWDRDSIYD